MIFMCLCCDGGSGLLVLMSVFLVGFSSNVSGVWNLWLMLVKKLVLVWLSLVSVWVC